MKTRILLIAMLACSVQIFAQQEKYLAFMKQNMTQLDTARTAAQFQQSANNFERIANAEKSEWQPAYYCAYALVMKAYYGAERKEIDGLMDKADAMLAMAESISPGNSEISTLKSMVLTARMQVDDSRGMTLGPKATEILQVALKQQPANNPRAMVQMAQMKFYTPAAFGGGKDAGIEMLKKGIAAYDSFKPASDLDPNWGKQYAIRLLEDWSK
jgi:hypothetical protein